MMQRLLIQLVKIYRFAFSPWLGSSCRYTPTCSAYSIEALALHGAIEGSYLTFKRLCRCHPWCAGGIDLVPSLHYISRPQTGHSSSSTESHQQ